MLRPSCYVNLLLSLGFVGLLSVGCSNSTPAASCPALSAGAAWVPNVPGVDPSNHDSLTTVASTTQSAAVTIIGLGQPAPAIVETSFSIDMAADLGGFGSVMLTAQVSGYPSDLQGGAFPLLVSINDGPNEYINLARSGASGDCWHTGYFVNSVNGYIPNPGCNIPSSVHSAYVDQTHWQQHQITNTSATNTPSTNMFPTCNWSGGLAPGALGYVAQPECAFTSTFFPGGVNPPRLRHGGGTVYTAKYVLVSDSYASISAGHTATVDLTITKKTKTLATMGGAFDLNVILVGNTTVSASRTAKGQQNLNTLIASLSTIYGQSSPNLKIGTVTPVEWTCAAGGETYANVDLSQLSDMFASSGTMAPAATTGKALNLFLVSSIQNQSGSTSGYTILGFDGAIGGPLINGTAVSGVTVSTFDTLDTANASCPLGTATCATNVQDSNFREASTVVAHELGHYFSLNHPSESDGSTHDIIKDTNICTATQLVGSDNVLTVNSCLNTDTNVASSGNTCSSQCASYNASTGSFCPTAVECQFNDVMWWTTKNFFDGGGSDGNLISTNSGTIMNYNPVAQ